LRSCFIATSAFPEAAAFDPSSAVLAGLLLIRLARLLLSGVVLLLLIPLVLLLIVLLLVGILLLLWLLLLVWLLGFMLVHDRSLRGGKSPSRPMAASRLVRTLSLAFSLRPSLPAGCQESSGSRPPCVRHM
jgi:hypothetical protein